MKTIRKSSIFILKLHALALGVFPCAVGSTIPISLDPVTTIKFDNKYDLGSHGLQSIYAFWIDLDSTTVLVTPDSLYRFTGRLEASTAFDPVEIGAAMPRVAAGSGNILLFFDAHIPSSDGARYLVSHDGARTFVSVDDALRYEWWHSGRNEWIADYFVVSTLQFQDNLIYANAGESPMLQVSQDGGISWEMAWNPLAPFGLVGNLSGVGRGLLVIDDIVLSGGEAPMDSAWIRRAKFDESRLQLKEEPEVVVDDAYLQFRNVQTLTYNPQTRMIYAGVEAAVLRSRDMGKSFEYILKYPNSEADTPVGLPPGDLNLAPYLSNLLTINRYASWVVAGGWDKADVSAYLAWSPDHGETWVNLSEHVRDLGQYTAFVVEDAHERILVGVTCGERGRLTIAELKLPDPIRDRYPGVERLGKGWWRDAAFGRFNAQWYPWQWHADWRGWKWNAEIADAGGHVMWDAEIGWLWMVDDLFPLVWHYESGGLVRLATDRPGRVFQRFEDGEWVDLEDR